MRYFGAAAIVALLAVVACAEQNNPLPDAPDETGDSGSGGSNSPGGKTSNGGTVSKAGSVGSAGKGGGVSAGGTSNDGGAPDATGGGATGGKPSGGAGGKGGSAGVGGKATGGAAGSAGSGGTAGSGGKAGSGGTGGGSGCTPSTSGPIGGISARYQNETAPTTSTSVGAQLEIYNAGPSTLNLADLKVRYYLSNEVDAALNKTINWAWDRPTAGGGQDDKKSKVMFNVVPMACKSANADTYFEFTFAADAGVLAANHLLVFSFGANNASNQNFMQTNDYSFDAAAKVDADNMKIVVLQNSGTRVWGTEP